MTGWRVLLVAVLAIAVGGCGAGAAPSPSPTPTSAPAVAATTDTLVPSSSPVAPTTPPTPAAQPSPSAQPVESARPVESVAPIPPKPTGVGFKVARRVETRNGSRETFRVTWKAPRTEGVEIQVWGVTECLSRPKRPKPDTSGKCLVPGTTLPKSALKPVVTAPAAAGKVTWTWDTLEYCDIVEYIWSAEPDPDGTEYYAIVLAAYDASDHSVFTIAYPGAWSEPGPGDMPC